VPIIILIQNFDVSSQKQRFQADYYGEFDGRPNKHEAVPYYPQDTLAFLLLRFPLFYTLAVNILTFLLKRCIM
jgi:hypothetical protein